MFGIILCGGKSTRMGSDKGLLKLEAKTWAQTAVDKLTDLNVPVKLSVNHDQFTAYSSVFSADELIIDDATLQIKGPLSGVLSCHLKFPAEDLFILACDMPLMEVAVLKELFALYQKYPSNDAFVFTNDGEPEPLCGIYTARGLASILSMLRSGQLIKHSMKFMLDHVSTKTIAASEEQKKCFRNFNAHAELNGL
jgi:molybdopterin-guanine dinucleotide biosynthesis protein A